MPIRPDADRDHYWKLSAHRPGIGSPRWFRSRPRKRPLAAQLCPSRCIDRSSASAPDRSFRQPLYSPGRRLVRCALSSTESADAHGYGLTCGPSGGNGLETRGNRLSPLFSLGFDGIVATCWSERHPCSDCPCIRPMMTRSATTGYLDPSRPEPSRRLSRQAPTCRRGRTAKPLSSPSTEPASISRGWDRLALGWFSLGLWL